MKLLSKPHHKFKPTAKAIETNTTIDSPSSLIPKDRILLRIEISGGVK